MLQALAKLVVLRVVVGWVSKLSVLVRGKVLYMMVLALGQGSDGTGCTLGSGAAGSGVNSTLISGTV